VDVSVIVPAYNAAPYIEECLASLVRSTQSLEVIVVNDGSTDTTSERVRDFRCPPNHSIVLLEQRNQGLSSARNAGLRAARGRFIGLVDGDDWIDPSMFTTMVAKAVELHADLVICNGEMVDHQSGASQPFHDHGRFRALAERFPTPAVPSRVPDMFRLDTSACKRLYARTLLDREQFQFAHGVLFEDVLAHFQLLFASQACLLIDRPFYKYRINHPGRITDRNDRSILTVFEVLRRSQESLNKHEATPDIWANFIWFQSWVLRWLGSQVDAQYRQEFMEGVVRVARDCPRNGIVAFQRMFAEDRLAQQTVALQLLGWKPSFLKLAADNAIQARPVPRLAMRLKALTPLLGRHS